MSDDEPKKYGRAAEPDHYSMAFQVKGKHHMFKIKRQRFEKTVDGIDKMVHSGKHDVDSIYAKFKDKMGGKPGPAYDPNKKKSPAEVVKAAFVS